MIGVNGGVVWLKLWGWGNNCCLGDFNGNCGVIF